MLFKHAKLPLALLALLFASCDKADERRSGERGLEQRAAWAYDSAGGFWEKQAKGGLQIDTAWEGDTTINF